MMKETSPIGQNMAHLHSSGVFHQSVERRVYFGVTMVTSFLSISDAGISQN